MFVVVSKVALPPERVMTKFREYATSSSSTDVELRSVSANRTSSSAEAPGFPVNRTDTTRGGVLSMFASTGLLSGDGR